MSRRTSVALDSLQNMGPDYDSRGSSDDALSNGESSGEEEEAWTNSPLAKKKGPKKTKPKTKAKKQPPKKRKEEKTLPKKNKNLSAKVQFLYYEAVVLDR